MATNIVGATGIDKVQDGIIVNADIDTVDAGKLTGTVADARISALTASKLTGALPAISGANLTGLSSFDPDGAVVFNESSADVDFRVESNSQTHQLFIDGGSTSVAIGTSAPETPQSTWDALQIGGNTILQSMRTADPTGEMELGFNMYRHSDGGNRHITTGLGCFIGMSSGAMKHKVSNGSQNADTNYTPLEALTIRNDGEIRIGNGDLVFSTAGKGVCLGVTSYTDANTLDDYEEGTWTLTCQNFGGTGTAQGTGYYVKVGKRCMFSAVLEASGGTVNPSTSCLVSLPFAGPVHRGGGTWSTGYNRNGGADLNTHPHMDFGDNTNARFFPQANFTNIPSGNFVTIWGNYETN